MIAEPVLLEVYHAGPLTVIGFGGREMLHEVNLRSLHDDVLQLVEEQDCRQLAMDLTGVQFVPSGLLGLLATLRGQGVEVLLYNASDDIRDVIESTNLHKTVQLHEVAV